VCVSTTISLEPEMSPYFRAAEIRTALICSWKETEEAIWSSNSKPVRNKNTDISERKDLRIACKGHRNSVWDLQDTRRGCFWIFPYKGITHTEEANVTVNMALNKPFLCFWTLRNKASLCPRCRIVKACLSVTQQCCFMDWKCLTLSMLIKALIILWLVKWNISWTFF
jgi:hypothetical protein